MISVLVGSTETQLDDGTIGYLTEHDGWAMPPQHRLEERSPIQHGVTDRGYRLDPRFGSLVFRFPSLDASDMYDRREQIINLFAPYNNPKLKFTLPNGKTRQIDAHYYDDLLIPYRGSSDGFSPIVALTLKCPDPTFYDPEEKIFYITGFGGTGWAIPWAIPWTIGSTSANVTNSIEYLGSFLTYPVITVRGPITAPKIENLTTGKKLEFSGSTTIADGSYYVIDTRFGKYTIVDGSGTDQSSKLTDDSHLTTFYIAASNEAPSGLNSIRLSGSSVSANTQLEIRYYERYLGI